MMQSNSTSSNPACLLHLAAGGELKPAVTLGQDLPPRVNGLAAFYYWKDAIVVGSYVHPTGKFTLDITRDKLDGYASTFRKMKRNGVGVPILMDHAQSAAATLGWIIDVKRRDDRLMELHQFLGETARGIGLRNKVSLGIDPNFIDGKGARYGEAIVHSAVTPLPVVPDQGEYEPVREMKMECNGREILTLSLSEAKDSSEPVEVKPDSPASPTSAQPTQGFVQLALNAIADAAAAKRDLAVARGCVDPAVADELFSLLVRSQDESANTLLLSRSANEVPIALAVFDCLARNRPVPLGEVTQLQVLSRTVPGLDPELVKLQERMIALASGEAST